jgi:hypothetical protein
VQIDEKDLDGFTSALVDKCMATRRERIQAYQGLYHYFLFGAQDGDQAPYGKIYPHIDLLLAYIYSQATVEYEVSVNNQLPVVFQQAELISKRATGYFHDFGIADKYSDATRLSLVWGSTLLKLNPTRFRDQPFCIEPYIIEPHNFGVLNESVPDLDRQEAFCEAYLIGRDELARRVSVLPNGDDIMRRVSAQPVTQDDTFPESIHRIIIGGTSQMTAGTTRGIVNIPELFNQLQYKPKTLEDQVEMYELTVWDDKTEDYRTVTLAAPGVVVYGRREIGNLLGIRGEHPYAHICPNRLHNYFFGWSEVTNLIRLQDWMSERLRDVRRILTLQAEPPKTFSGFGGLNDEKAAAFNTPGAWVSDPTPGAKVEMLAPEIPNDMFQEIYSIQSFYNDISGLSDVLQGKGDTGVRSKAQTDTLAKLGSARIKQRAQSVERSLEEVGGLMVKMMKKKDEHKYFLEEGQERKPFLAAQFTDDFQVHVDAHSASPVFVDDNKQTMFALAKLGIVDGASVIEGVKPPRSSLLVQRWKELQAAKAKQQQQEAQQQQQGGAQPPANKGLKAV